MINNYQFSNAWFDGAARSVWDVLIPQIMPNRILEIGSYEGASACYMIEKLGLNKDIEIHCIDTWEGGIEHKKGGSAETEMSMVEARFTSNIEIARKKYNNKANIIVHKGSSDLELAKLLALNYRNYFDFIYVDGSHQASDVFCDAALSFRLLKVGGYLIFDDYTWNEPLSYGVDPIRSPKIAIDAFTTIYCRKIKIINAPLYQLYLQKLSD